MDPVFHFIDYLCTRIPGIKLAEKKKVWWMRVLGKLCFFNRDFMTRTVTVVGKTIYLPSNLPHDLSLLGIIAHEYVHIYDGQEIGPIYTPLYLYPQSLSLLSLLAIGAWNSLWYLLFLSLLLMLFPMNAPWRIRFEQRAYAMSLLFSLWTKGRVSAAMVGSTVDIVHSGTYYWPGGNEKITKLYFEVILEDAQRGVLPPNPVYHDVWQYLKSQKYLANVTTQT